MGNAKKNKKDTETTAVIRNTLSKCVDLESLYDNYPHVFDFSLLSQYDKLSLVDASPAKFIPLFDVNKFSPQIKLVALTQVKNKEISKVISFSDQELAKLTNDEYFRLLSYDFKKYIRVDRYKELCCTHKEDIFLKYTQWVLDNFKEAPKFTMLRLSSIAAKNPGFIDTHITDFSRYTTNSSFWRTMISHDESYMAVFIRNTKSCVSKTEVRSIVYTYPEIIRLLDADAIADSKLSCKEWLLLIASIINRNPKKFRGFSFPPDMIDMIKLDVTAELLNGKSKLTGQFKNAMAVAFGITEEENEDTTVDG